MKIFALRGIDHYTEFCIVAVAILMTAFDALAAPLPQPKPTLDEIIDVLNRRYFRWPEQDVMNYLCQGRILDMPHEYNACECVRHSYVRIRHYAAEKIEEWRKDKLACQYREMSWDRALELHEGQVAKRV